MLGVVYKLRCLDLSIKEFYVGSSFNIKDRMKGHKYNCNNPNSKKYNLKVYKYIRANQGWENWTYEILEECDVEDKEELELCYEDTWIVNLNPQLNCIRARRTQKEYREDNKEKIKEYNKEWWEKNKEKMKEYYQQNKEQLAEYHKKYREENKERISQKSKEKLQCECGSIHSRQNKAPHEKTKKHKLYLSSR